MLISQRGMTFFTDTYVTIDPSAEELAEMTMLAAEEIRRFGVEPKAIWGVPGFPRRLRAAALAQYLTFSFVPGEGTMLEDIFELPVFIRNRNASHSFFSVCVDLLVDECGWQYALKCHLASDALKQEFKDFDMATGSKQVVPPSVQSVLSK